MSTPSIQTLITQAQQVLNLKSTNEIRATLAAILANANVGTPLNPSLTTQQLWDEFYEIVRQPSDDIMSIITDQMMRMVFSPPAPGGAGADKQVIFNDGGVLAGDTKFLWDKNANRLDVDGPVTITGDLTVRTTGLTVNSSGVGIGTNLQSSFVGNSPKKLVIGDGTQTPALTLYGGSANVCGLYFADGTVGNQAYRGYVEYDHNTDSFGLGISGSLAMTLNATGLGVGVTPAGTGGCLQLKSGITFPATQVASSDANTLDDYEEGTWTATLKGSVSDPTTPVTATGRYTKIGRQVSIQLFVNNVTTTGASGRIQIDGLPFANNGSVEAISNVGFYNMATFTGVPFGLTSASSTVIDMWSSVSAGVFQAVNYNPGSVQYVWVNLTYTV